MKRLLDCSASDFRKMEGRQLKQAIQASEGRVIVAEVIGEFAPLYPAITNAELAAAFGADLLLLNWFDVFRPVVNGLDVNEPDHMVERLKQLTGRPVGVNLEPVDPNAKQLEALASLPKGRMATAESLQQAKRLGVDFICLTGNPKTGVTNDEIVKAIETARAVLGEDALIIAGKMHAAGVADEAGSGIVSEEVVVRFIRAGADIVLMPAPGTVPGVTLDKTEKLVRVAHEHGALVMLTIGQVRKERMSIRFAKSRLRAKWPERICTISATLAIMASPFQRTLWHIPSLFAANAIRTFAWQDRP